MVFVVALAARLAVVAWAHARFPAAEDGHYYDVLARRLAAGAGLHLALARRRGDVRRALPGRLPGARWRSPTRSSAPRPGVGDDGQRAPRRARRVRRAPPRRRRRRRRGGVRSPRASSWRSTRRSSPYTAALMTEGVTAALLVVAAAAASRARGGPARPSLGDGSLGLGVVLGVATLVRPQSLAPRARLRGARASPWPRRRPRQRTRGRRRGDRASPSPACAPWTARNCVRMHRCALVSVNGGWNLLIGAHDATRAPGQPMPVPAGVPHGLGRGGEGRVLRARARGATSRRAPSRGWRGRPRKLAATFDYFGAAPWYLHASNAAAFDERAKIGARRRRDGRVPSPPARRAGGVRPDGRAAPRRAQGRRARRGRRRRHAARVDRLPGHSPVPLSSACGLWRAAPRRARRGGGHPRHGAMHAVFFGAGRYGLVVAPFVAALAFVRRARTARPAAGAPDGRRRRARDAARSGCGGR